MIKWIDLQSRNMKWMTPPNGERCILSDRNGVQAIWVILTLLWDLQAKDINIPCG